MKVGIGEKGLGVVRILQYVDLTRRSPLWFVGGSRRLLYRYRCCKVSMYGVTWSCAADYLYYMCGSAKSRLRDYKGGVIRVRVTWDRMQIVNQRIDTSCGVSVVCA